MEVEPAQAADAPDPGSDALVRGITRPRRQLLTYYVLGSLLTGPFAPFVAIPLFFRYHTLRYHFGDDGISVAWGVLFRREHHLTYRRIQDIHVTRNFIERWLGIGTVSVQTASGSGGAEAEIVGVREYEAIRDFLYRRMRGLDVGAGAEPEAPEAVPDEDPVELLREIRDSLRAVREHLEGDTAAPGDPAP